MANKASKTPLASEPVDMSKGKRITGQARTELGAQLRVRYEEGATIRELTEATGRSFGWVNNVLRESGATIRPRGGARVRT